MKILIVCSGTTNKISPFVFEQAESIERLGVEINYFTIDKPGIKGYLNARKPLINKIQEYCPDLIHAHYGFSGLLANLQRKVPVITTYHGSDINNSTELLLSKIVIKLSFRNIYVSKKLALKANDKAKCDIIPCGVDFDNFQVIDKSFARKQLGFNIERKYILFSSHFENKVKNYDLARKVIELVKKRGVDIELLEYKGYSRKVANILFNAVDCVLVTSFKESGPLVIKEAMAVNTPAVSVDVGDVSEVTNKQKGYFITSYNKFEIADTIIKCLHQHRNRRTNGRPFVQYLDQKIIAKRLLQIYNLSVIQLK